MRTVMVCLGDVAVGVGDEVVELAIGVDRGRIAGGGVGEPAGEVAGEVCFIAGLRDGDDGQGWPCGSASFASRTLVVSATDGTLVHVECSPLDGSGDSGPVTPVSTHTVASPVGGEAVAVADRVGDVLHPREPWIGCVVETGSDVDRRCRGRGC